MKMTSFMKKLFAAAASVLCLSAMPGSSLKPGADLMQTPAAESVTSETAAALPDDEPEVQDTDHLKETYLNSVRNSGGCIAALTHPERTLPYMITASASGQVCRTQEQALAWVNARIAEKWGVDVDGFAGCQCVDLIKEYLKFMTNGATPNFIANAYEYASKALPAGFTRVYSDPQPCDIVVWDRNKGCAGSYGHVGIVIRVSGGTITVAETNYSGMMYVTVHDHPISGTSCFIRPAYEVPIPPAPVLREGSAMTKSAGQTIQSGLYSIRSQISPNLYVDAPGTDNTELTSPTNAATWNDEQLAAYDAYDISFNSEGYAEIRLHGANLVLGVKGGSRTEQTPVQFETPTGAASQQWSIEQTDNGYQIRSRCSSFMLDVKGASAENGTQMIIYPENSSIAQRYCFIPIASDEDRILEDGEYTVRSVLGDGAFTVGADGESGSYTDETNVLLTENGQNTVLLKYFGDGWYSIADASTGLVWDIYNENEADYLKNSRNIQLFTDNGTSNQLWKLVRNDDGSIQVFSRQNGYCIDLTGGTCKDGGNIAAYPQNTSAAQRWLFEKVIPKPKQTLAGDIDCDGNVSVSDAVMLARFLAEDNVKMTELGRINADVNNDGNLDAADKAMVLMIIARIPVETWQLDDGTYPAESIKKEYWEYDVISTKTSASSTMSGWKLISSEWKQNGTGKHVYAAFPSGFNQSDARFDSIAKSAGKNTESKTKKRVYSAATVSEYIYWHWVYPMATKCSENDRYIGEYCGEKTPSGTCTIWEAFSSSANVNPSDGSGTACKITGHSDGYSYWWFKLPVYQQSYTDYEKQYTFRKTEHVKSETAPAANLNAVNVKHYVLVTS